MIICYNTVPDIQYVMDLILIFYVGLFLPFYPLPPNIPKNQNLKKMKKIPGDIIILHMCTKDNDHMIYSSSNIVCNRLTDQDVFQKFWEDDV